MSMTSKQVREMNARLRRMLGDSFDPGYYSVHEPEREAPIAEHPPMHPVSGRKVPKKKGLEDNSTSENNS